MMRLAVIHLLHFYMLFLITFCSTYGSTKKTSRTKAQKLESKVYQLQTLSENGLISMNNERFHQFVKTLPRNYSMYIMFTALNPQRQCRLCLEAHEAFKIVWHSWRISPQYEENKSRFFLGLVDFDEAQDVFRSFGFNTAPVFMHFSSSSVKSRQDTFDGQVKGFSADSLARWISERSNVQKFKISPPPDYDLILRVLLFAALTITIVVTQYKWISAFLGRTQWACIILLIALWLMSGHMWNSIRQPPFYGRDRFGHTSYLAPGSSSQYGVETYVMMTLYGSATVGMVLLNDGARYFAKREFKQISAVVGLAIYFVFVNLILGVFSSKYHGYPYNYVFNL